MTNGRVRWQEGWRMKKKGDDDNDKIRLMRNEGNENDDDDIMTYKTLLLDCKYFIRLV